MFENVIPDVVKYNYFYGSNRKFVIVIQLGDRLFYNEFSSWLGAVATPPVLFYSTFRPLVNETIRGRRVGCTLCHELAAMLVSSFVKYHAGLSGVPIDLIEFDGYLGLRT